jgi:predicted PurR-regulated permease PerM
MGLIAAVAILYFARELLIPLAFAMLLAFLLSPAVKRLETWRIPRTPAAILVLTIAFAILTVVGWMVAAQMIEIAGRFKGYTQNIRHKIAALQGQSGPVDDFLSNMEDLGRQLNTPKMPEAQPPMKVEIVEPRNVLQTVRGYAGTLLAPLGTAGLIMVFTLFMLIDRENLRNRLLRLMGEQKLQATTKAIDDAGHRVSRYVLLQFAVNAGFGTVIATGLYFLGVPNWFLWGVLGLFLRFLPYIGPIVAGVLPFTMAVAVSDGWSMPMSVFFLFLLTELIVGNFLEPMLYGVNTGLSAVAILVSAVFWTVVWGPVGLVLATPLTVCLSVLGKHSQQFEFLNVVLGDEAALAPAVLFYQRLLALDQQDALAVLESLGKDKPLIAVFDEIVIPALAMAERDRHIGQLDAKREDFVVESINEFVTELTEADATPFANRAMRRTRVFCIPAHDAADEIAAAMCAHFLTQEGYPAIAFPVSDSPAELISNLGCQPDDVVCISAVPPFAAGNTRKVAKSIGTGEGAPSIVAGLWTYGATGEARVERLKKSLGAVVARSLAEAVAKVRAVDREA